jgi:hypothetical protein
MFAFFAATPVIKVRIEMKKLFRLLVQVRPCLYAEKPSHPTEPARSGVSSQSPSIDEPESILRYKMAENSQDLICGAVCVNTIPAVLRHIRYDLIDLPAKYLY